MPPAFALSQDQTLKFIRSNASIPATPLRIARPSASELRHHSLQYLSPGTEVASSPRHSLTSSPGRVPFPGPPAGSPAPNQPTAPPERQPRILPPKVHPAAALRPPQHPHRFKHAAQRPTSRRASLLQITPRPTQVTQLNPPDHPGKTARLSTVKPLFGFQGANPYRTTNPPDHPSSPERHIQTNQHTPQGITARRLVSSSEPTPPSVGRLIWGASRPVNTPPRSFSGPPMSAPSGGPPAVRGWHDPA